MPRWQDAPLAVDDSAPAWQRAPLDPVQKMQLLEQPQVNAPGGIMNAIIAGLQSSSGGLILRGEAPDTALNPDAAWYERAAFNAAGVVGDLPAMIVGGAAGSAGGPVGTGAGAFAVPSAIREALMTAYETGGVDTWEELWAVTKSGLTGGTKGAVIGGATFGVGKFVKGLGGGVATRSAAEITTMVTTGSALEGRMPTAQDFMDAAIVVGGLHAAVNVAGRLRNVYAKTGVPPEEVAMEAQRNPELKDQLLKSDEIPVPLRVRAAEENAAAAVPDPKLVDRATAEQFRESPFAAIPQMKGEPTRPTHVNYEYLNTPEEVQGALSRLSQLYEEKIQTQRRGEVPNEQTVLEAKARLADVLGATGERTPGMASNAAELLARKQLAVGAAEELVARGKALAELGEAASPAQITQFLAQTERSAMILSEFLGARAETGRALQILKSTAKMSQKLEDMQKAIESYGGREGAIKLAEAISKAEDAAAALQAAKKAVEPTVGEKIIEVWKASILSGLTTHMANITGNTMSLAMSLPERAIAAAIGKARGSQAGERVELAETHALGTGMVRGVVDGLKLARETIMGRAPMSDKIDQPRGAIKGKTGEIVRIPFKALSAGDALFRTMAERGELYAQAVRSAHKEGFTPTTREFNARVEELVQNPTEAALAAAKVAGDKGVFTTKLGKIGTHLQLATRGTPLEFVLPFIRTPANLLKWAAERIPGVNLLMESVRNDISGKNGKIAQDMAMARMVVGGVVATIVAAAVRDGSITGGGLSDPDKRRTMMAAGWQPYSIKIGDTYYSYARLDPLGRVMATVADTFEIIDAIEADDADKLNVYGVVVAAIGNATVSQTYLSGLANAIGAITDPERYGGRWLDQYAASLVPSLVGQTAAAMDSQAREVNSVFDAIQNRIPIWREELLPKRNLLTGEPIEPTRAFPMAPVTTTTESKDKVLTEAARLGIRLPIAPKKVHVGKGTGKLGDVKITPEARNAYTEAQGKFAHQILSQIVASPGWDGMPDIVKEGIYSKVLRSARQQAALVALPPEARAVEIQRIANEIQGQLTR